VVGEQTSIRQGPAKDICDHEDGYILIITNDIAVVLAEGCLLALWLACTNLGKREMFSTKQRNGIGIGSPFHMKPSLQQLDMMDMFLCIMYMYTL